MRQHILIESALGRANLKMGDLARIFTLLLQEQAITSNVGKGALVNATFSGSSDQQETYRGQSRRNTDKKKKKCPCKPNGLHFWDPIACNRLYTAITGSTSEKALRTALSNFNKQKIKERYNSHAWASLRNMISDSGWKVSGLTTPSGLSGTSG
ncbi:uncharacterized protein M421DRAFT_387831 [Didymella exigua CBS 183.55]|uniref:Uncharacterized protein n=1 Tax=Didymella exigua CBS 183.55 TaxID=1150837 RepID=A0A6A5R656_9PLEO|nr:uncharacterized protein M421DRAFT_387831 [Didymella exigua CBS 183.55]KAF1922206.1 hypothetical protein M421DRAFT_387831 [Didymella exigua CBS 183.55]